MEMKMFIVKYGCGHKDKAPGIHIQHAKDYAEDNICDKCSEGRMKEQDKKHDEAMQAFWAKKRHEHEEREAKAKAEQRIKKKKKTTTKKKKVKSARIRVQK